MFQYNNGIHFRASGDYHLRAENEMPNRVTQ